MEHHQIMYIIAGLMVLLGVYLIHKSMKYEKEHKDMTQEEKDKQKYHKYMGVAMLVGAGVLVYFQMSGKHQEAAASYFF